MMMLLGREDVDGQWSMMGSVPPSRCLAGDGGPVTSHRFLRGGEADSEESAGR